MPTSETNSQTLILYFPNGTNKAYEATNWEVDPHTRVLKFTSAATGATIWTTLPFETTDFKVILKIPNP
jgi:hypothetical protein